jgi:NAD(P)-dependent dehydrogenase (short-subunit alcohol dehydrogenase family)
LNQRLQTHADLSRPAKADQADHVAHMLDNKRPRMHSQVTRFRTTNARAGFGHTLKDETLMTLQGKVAVVLGASAAGGTGWAVAEALAAAGAKVVVSARRSAPLEVLARKIGGTALACDAGKPDQVTALACAAAEAHGLIDIAVNCAARPTLGSIADADQTIVQRSLEVNFLGQVSFVREMASVMRDGGAIVLFSSASSVQPVLPFFPYACAKAATDCLVRYAALEYGPRGIRVNSIQPGPIKTEMASPLFAVPGAEAVFMREIPLRRVGMPEDFAQAVLSLVGPGYITGVNLPVSGGMHLTRAPYQDEIPKSGGFGEAKLRRE